MLIFLMVSVICFYCDISTLDRTNVFAVHALSMNAGLTHQLTEVRR